MRRILLLCAIIGSGCATGSSVVPLETLRADACTAVKTDIVEATEGGDLHPIQGELMFMGATEACRRLKDKILELLVEEDGE